MKYERILNYYGWSKYGDCICGGTYYDKYSHPAHEGWEIWCAPDLGSFRVLDSAKEIKADDRAFDRLEKTITLNRLF